MLLICVHRVLEATLQAVGLVWGSASLAAAPSHHLLVICLPHQPDRCPHHSWLRHDHAATMTQLAACYFGCRRCTRHHKGRSARYVSSKVVQRWCGAPQSSVPTLACHAMSQALAARLGGTCMARPPTLATHSHLQHVECSVTSDGIRSKVYALVMRRTFSGKLHRNPPGSCTHSRRRTTTCQRETNKAHHSACRCLAAHPALLSLQWI